MPASKASRHTADFTKDCPKQCIAHYIYRHTLHPLKAVKRNYAIIMSFIAESDACKHAFSEQSWIQLHSLVAPVVALTQGGRPATGHVGGQLGFLASGGHAAENPSQVSCRSHVPLAALQTVVLGM